MTPPPAPVAINPYHEDDLIFVMTTPPERTSMLAPRWKGPFLVKRVPNAYQATYEDDMVWRIVHVNHVKPAKPRMEASPSLCHHLTHHRHLLCTSPRNLQWRRTAKPPQPAAPAAESPQPAAAPLATAPPRVNPPHALQPDTSWLLVHSHSREDTYELAGWATTTTLCTSKPQGMRSREPPQHLSC